MFDWRKVGAAALKRRPISVEEAEEALERPPGLDSCAAKAEPDLEDKEPHVTVLTEELTRDAEKHAGEGCLSDPGMEQVLTFDVKLEAHSPSTSVSVLE